MDSHEGRGRGRDRGSHRRSHGRWGGRHLSAPDSQRYRPRSTDPGLGSHEGQEHLHSGEKCQDGNKPGDSSSCANAASNPIKQNLADSLADKGTPSHMKPDISYEPSPIKGPETCQTPLQNSSFVSRPLPDHMHHHKSQGRGFYQACSGGRRSSPPASQHHRPRVSDLVSSSHGGPEHLNSGEKRRDGNSPSEPSSCAGVESNQIRQKPADLLADKGTIRHMRSDMSSEPSPIKALETPPLNSYSASQPLLDHMDCHEGRGFDHTDRRGGRGRGWQSSTSAPQRHPHGFTDPRLSSYRGQERVNIGGNSPTEPSSCASFDSNPIRQNPAADSMTDYASITCRFANLDTSPGSSSITGPGTPGSDGKSDNSEQAFDICSIKKTNVILLQPSLLNTNKEKRKELQRTMEGKNWRELKKGMILLKGYLSLSEQIKIVKQCRNSGVGRGGFYQPGYRDGGKLQLNMMCLGKNWDPETSSYGDHRPSNGAKPPVIPTEFYQLVQRAIKDSHSVIEERYGVGRAEKQLPWMTPDICIVNFYSSTGRLGFHQDRDESERSIGLGLPVVSFSIGDTAEFLYGDQRDVDEARMVNLESGDVLIFGGESRRVFHGVKAIKPDTAPKTLSSESNLRPGRLNLTFRQY